jgi:hypothetical protein
MDIECMCGSRCVRYADEILLDIKLVYVPCDKCLEPGLKKFKPLKDQVDLERLNSNYGKCSCGKRHLDVVMAHTLKIMIEEGIRDEKSTLRNTCTPLITPAYPTRSAPYLKTKSLVILAEGMTQNCADRIINEIPEIKGVLNGNINQTVGVLDSDSSPHVYKLLAGCDMRCDVILNSYGALCIYRNQAEIHVEFSKPVSPKIEALKKFIGKYKSPSVLDCTCGPGTLGIVCLKAGSKRVVFNDIWYPAAKMTSINLEVNGFQTDLFKVKKGLIGIGNNYSIYCEDVNNLKNVLNEKFDICIVDTFPGVDTDDFVNSIKEMCSEIVVI